MELLIFGGILIVSYLLDTVFDIFTNDDPSVSLDATSGDDVLTGTNGDDFLSGLAGDDLITGLRGSDLLDGGAGNDTLVGNEGSDLLDGGAGDDTVIGGFGNDVLLGGAGSDTLTGHTGSDFLVGGGSAALEAFLMTGVGVVGFDDFADREADSLNGGAGSDVLVLDRSDTGTGGDGADAFVVFESADQTGSATITDFDQSADSLIIDYRAADFAVVPTVTVVDFTDGTGADILMDGVLVAQVTGAQGLSASSVSIEALA
jgi:Ca2+-binding RTX toxin-like protein